MAFENVVGYSNESMLSEIKLILHVYCSLSLSGQLKELKMLAISNRADYNYNCWISI